MKTLKYIVIIIGSIAALLLILWGSMSFFHCYAFNNFPETKDIEIPALFGDSFGAVNALISAFAFIGVIIALFMQQKQLKLQNEDLKIQQKELKSNTEELKLQREEFHEQNKNLRLQRFENTFFQMMSLHHEIVRGLKYKGRIFTVITRNDNTEEVVGREVFQFVYQFGEVEIANGMNKQKFFGLYKAIQHHYSNVKNVFLPHSPLFDHYFQNLFQIFLFIDRTSDDILSISDKKTYCGIVKANLSEYELVLLFFYCLHEERFGNVSFKVLAEKYCLFNNLRKESVGEDVFNKYENMYEVKAFRQ